MFTSQAASMLRTLDGAMPNTSLRDMVQIFANCSQSLSHRGGTDLSPPAFPYLKNGVNTKAPLSWNPDSPGYNLGPSNNNGYYNNVGGSPSYDFSSGDYSPFFEGPSNFSDNSSWNAINENSYSFPFAQNIRSDNLYGGPTFNVAGDSYFDNSHADTYNGDTVNTNNINIGGGSIKFGDTYIDNSVVQNYFGDQNGGNNIGNINIIGLIGMFNRRIPTLGIANASRRRYVAKCVSASRKFLKIDTTPTTLDISSHIEIKAQPTFTGSAADITIDSTIANSAITGNVTYSKASEIKGNAPITAAIGYGTNITIPNYTGNITLNGNIPYPRLNAPATTKIFTSYTIGEISGSVNVASINATPASFSFPTKWTLNQSTCTIEASENKTINYITAITGGGGNAKFTIGAQSCTGAEGVDVVTEYTLYDDNENITNLTASLTTNGNYNIPVVSNVTGNAAINLSGNAITFTDTAANVSKFSMVNGTIKSAVANYTPAGTISSIEIENTSDDLTIPNVKEDAYKTVYLSSATTQEALFLDGRIVTLR